MTEEEYQRIKDDPISINEYLTRMELLPWHRVVLLQHFEDAMKNKEQAVVQMRGRRK